MDRGTLAISFRDERRGGRELLFRLCSIHFQTDLGWLERIGREGKKGGRQAKGTNVHIKRSVRMKGGRGRRKRAD